MSNIKCYKQLIEHDGHTFLVEMHFDFQQIFIDPKDGYIPHLQVFKIREIDIEEKYDDEMKEDEEDYPVISSIVADSQIKTEEDCEIIVTLALKQFEKKE